MRLTFGLVLRLPLRARLKFKEGSCCLRAKTLLKQKGVRQTGDPSSVQQPIQPKKRRRYVTLLSSVHYLTRKLCSNDQ